MSDSQFKNKILKDINKEIDEVSHSLLNGNASGFDDYKFKVGRITALKTAIRITEESYKLHLGGELDENDENIVELG